MEKCVRCGRNSDEVRLYDGISISGNMRLCERCALLSNTPIIKRPSTGQLKDSEKPAGVRERLMRMNHLDNGEKKEESVFEEIKKLESQPDLERPEDLVFKLVDNFHWTLQTERRRKGFTTKQLADALKESEEAIKLLEKGIVPSKSLDLIRSLEQFLNIRIIRRDLIEEIEEKRKNEERVNALLSVNKPEIVPASIGGNILEESRPISLKYNEAEQFKIRDLQRLNEKIDNDFEAQKKSVEQVGNEQLSSFGKEDTEHIKKQIFPKEKPKSTTPSIYELMKKKEERVKVLSGSDIQIIDETKEKKQEVKWEDLE
ncbi:MAG: hypothetical protein AABX17_00615 [Nanoarchaeota archaeon]